MSTPNPAAIEAATPRTKFSFQAINAATQLRDAGYLYLSIAGREKPLEPVLEVLMRAIENTTAEKESRISQLERELAAAKEKYEKARAVAADEAITALEKSNAELREALEIILNRYTGLVNSGDAGNWDPEQEVQVIAARKVLAQQPTPRE